MARAYSVDLRERAVAAVLVEGLSCAAAAERFGVSESSVIKWVRRMRETGSVAPDKMGGRRGKLLDDERDWLMARMAAKPDLTLSALLEEVRARGNSVCLDTLWRFLKSLGLSFKKKPFTPPSRTGPTSHGAGTGGASTRRALSRRGWCSSTKLG
jgi:transposase